MKVKVNPGEAVMHALKPAEGKPAEHTTYTEGEEFECTVKEGDALIKAGVVTKVSGGAPAKT